MNINNTVKWNDEKNLLRLFNNIKIERKIPNRKITILYCLYKTFPIELKTETLILEHLKAFCIKIK